MRKKDSESNVEESVSLQRPPITPSNSMWLLRKPLVDEPLEDLQPGKEPGKDPSVKSAPSRPPTRDRSMTTSSFWPGRMNTKDESKELPTCPPPTQRMPTKSPSPSRSNTLDGGEGKNFQSFLFAD
jgi:hypothetical protein